MQTNLQRFFWLLVLNMHGITNIRGRQICLTLLKTFICENCDLQTFGTRTLLCIKVKIRVNCYLGLSRGEVGKLGLVRQLCAMHTFSNMELRL